MPLTTEKQPKADAPIVIVGATGRIDGYAYGLRQAALLLNIHVPANAQWPDGRAERIVNTELDLDSAPLDGSSQFRVLRGIMRWAVALQIKAGLPAFENALIVSRSEPNLIVVLPCLTANSGLLAMRGAILLVTRSLAIDWTNDENSTAELKGTLAKVVERLTHAAPKGFNNFHFLRAAHDLGAPWSQIGDDVYQIGWGSRARWLSSSFTDATPQISARLARDKTAAAAILRAGGVSVPDHATARNEDEAVSLAQRLGYPVVVKPADLDGGLGVGARLNTPAEVRMAFASARQHSKRVLVEKHVEGRDYRLHVVGEAVMGILERVPGGVMGDGQHSVAELLQAQNLMRRTATDDRKYLKEMTLDTEALRMLAAADLTPSFVPALDQVVRLRAMANVASGGVPVPIEPDLAHPDNLDLAVRATRLLRLDVAGVDLLIPDIARSWMETGAAICEVNAQPQMFTTLHRPMLSSLLRGGTGRIPVLVALGETAAEVSVAVHSKLDSPSCKTGLAGSDGVQISHQCIARGPIGLLEGGRMLLRDQQVDAAILWLNGHHGLPAGGWPVDRCDVLVLTAVSTELPAERTMIATWFSAIQMLRPRTVVATSAAVLKLRQSERNLPQDIDLQVIADADIDRLARASLEALLGSGSSVD